VFKEFEDKVNDLVGMTDRTHDRVYAIRELMGWVNVWVPLLGLLLFANIVMSGILLYQVQKCREGIDRIESKLDAMETKRVEASLAKP
jgi:hypothetical protein